MPPKDPKAEQKVKATSNRIIRRGKAYTLASCMHAYTLASYMHACIHRTQCKYSIRSLQKKKDAASHNKNV